MKHLRIFSFLFVLSALTMAALPGSPASAVGEACFVDVNAGGLNNGSSWTNAYTDLQSTLGGSTCTEVWVADGTYKPTTGTDRNASFQLKSGVAIYGGFAGTESTRDERDPAANVSILSGEIGAADNSDNSYHVVRGANSATLDGFTITAGNANGDACPVGSTGCGGGIYNSYTNPTLSNLIVSGNAGNRGGGIYNGYCSPILSNLTIRNNTATDGGGMLNWVSHPSITNITTNLNTASGSGGGMYNYSSYPQITGATFSTNSAGTGGGGMYNMGGSGPGLRNVTFNGNTAGDGAGMGNHQSSPTLYRVTFQGNTANGFGGGMNNWLNSNPTLTNVTFSGNSAGNASGNGGGGMNNYSSDPSLMNVTFNNNSASGGGGMFNWQSNPILKNITFSANSASSSGGGIANWFTDTTQTWANLTFANNTAGSSGGAIFNYHGGDTLNIANTIFWGNTASSGPQFNRDSWTTPIVVYSVIQGGCPMDVICMYHLDGDPVLGLLGNYGGYTQTIPFYGTSPLDQGLANSDCPPTDQRGVPRPKGTACDIGAYESLDSLAPETMIDDQNPHLSPTRSTSMAITFSGTDIFYGINHFECSLDGAGFSPCTSPITYNGLGDGEHTFRVFAVNNHNDPDPTPASYSWTVDATPPTLSLPANITAEATSPAGTSVTFTVTATDTVDPSPVISCSPPSGSTFALDVITTVNCTASDDMGNVSSGSFTITVVDTTPPNLSLPANIIAEAASAAGAVVNFTVTASDAADPSPTVSCAPPSGSTFALDVITTVNCTASDDMGNVSSGSFTITVVDTTPPNLSLPANIIAEAASAAGAVVNFTVSATDTVDPSPVISCTPPSGSTFPLGDTTVNCTTSDRYGNIGLGSFTVTVRDSTLPILSLPANITAEATSAAGAVVNFTVSATDGVDPDPLVSCAPPSGSTFAITITTVNCTATDDAGNVASGNFTVSVQDTTAPTLILPADMTVLPSGPAGAVVNFTVSATDAVDPDPVVSCTPPSGSTFPIATTTVNCTATDNAGNVATGSFTITVGGTRISAAFRSFGAYDGTLRESSEISGISNFANVGGALITVGDDSYKRQYMGILDFDTSTLPEGAAITEVTLQVKVSILSANIYTALGDLMAEVANPHFGTLPNLQTADFTAPSLADAGLFSRAVAGNNWITLNMDPSSLFAVNTAGRTQFRLRFQVDDSNNLLKHDLRFFSGNYLLATYHPQLTIVYYVP